ncbi:hypothetical protein BDR03DRAFT_337435 [Suillus americanus]|nr:hypothetical protein BDR03DRAFT_337435 [Suillus americanus]
MARNTTRGSSESFPQLQGPVFMRRPSQASIDHLSNPRLPVRYLQAGLKMNSQIYSKTQRIIRDLALRHIDFSIPYLEQSQSQIDFFKREALLDVELSHLTWYQDAWVVEVLLRVIYHRPRIMKNFQELDSELQIIQHDRPRQMSLIVCPNSQATQPGDTQVLRYSTDNYAPGPPNTHDIA